MAEPPRSTDPTPRRPDSAPRNKPESDTDQPAQPQKKKRTPYYFRDPKFPDHVIGPIPGETLVALAKQGDLQPTDEVSIDRTLWVPATKVRPSLFPEDGVPESRGRPERTVPKPSPAHKSPLPKRVELSGESAANEAEIDDEVPRGGVRGRRGLLLPPREPESVTQPGKSIWQDYRSREQAILAYLLHGIRTHLALWSWSMDRLTVQESSRFVGVTIGTGCILQFYVGIGVLPQPRPWLALISFFLTVVLSAARLGFAFWLYSLFGGSFDGKRIVRREVSCTGMTMTYSAILEIALTDSFLGRAIQRVLAIDPSEVVLFVSILLYIYVKCILFGRFLAGVAGIADAKSALFVTVSSVALFLVAVVVGLILGTILPAQVIAPPQPAATQPASPGLQQPGTTEPTQPTSPSPRPPGKGRSGKGLQSEHYYRASWRHAAAAT